MSNQKLVLSALACFITASCASGPPFIDKAQPQAVSMALRRGQFEMNCPAATASVLSREEIQPLANNIRFQGTVRAEYTVGVAGCGKQASYVVICPENGGSCFAGGGRTEIHQ
jgi:hypothetical protein